jgi:hypothetical protein
MQHDFIQGLFSEHGIRQLPGLQETRFENKMGK